MSGNKRTPSSGINQGIKTKGPAGGNVQVVGNSNVIRASAQISTGAPNEVLQGLAAIQDALSKNPATKALAEAATEQAKTDNPDKGAIGTQLKAAFDIAKTTSDWAEVASTLSPYIKTVAGWLGGSWLGAL
jgi:hypothetical protein